MYTIEFKPSQRRILLFIVDRFEEHLSFEESQIIKYPTVSEDSPILTLHENAVNKVFRILEVANHWYDKRSVNSVIRRIKTAMGIGEKRKYRARHVRRSRAEKRIEVESMVMEWIQSWFDQYNMEYFKNNLKTPIFEFHDGRSKWGWWKPEFRTISLSRYLIDAGMDKMKATLKHEMAHQFVHEVLNIHDAPKHGKLFEQIAQENEFESLQEMGQESEDNKGRDDIIKKVEK
ncbi:MAG: SprT-like domain-containing protein, partial [Planctomycetes bacterium]|nr:SprT-like domain-containing protein [Planctomycetota bacterium]